VAAEGVRPPLLPHPEGVNRQGQAGHHPLSARQARERRR
jgi:hypothetical protein